MIARTMRLPRTSILILLVLFPLLLAGCAAPWAAAPARGNSVLHSPECHCHFTYPAAWHYAAANGDAAVPTLNLANYDTSSADHAPVPRTFALIGVSWLGDPLGQLYLAAATRHLSSGQEHRLVVSGRAATSFGAWTAPPAQGGVYVEHVYLFVPWYQRDYDVSFQAANPPSGDVSALRRVFVQVLRSMVIVPPNVLP